MEKMEKISGSEIVAAIEASIVRDQEFPCHGDGPSYNDNTGDPGHNKHVD